MAQRIHLFLPFFLPSVGLVALCVSAGQTQHRSRDYISAETNFVRIQVTVFDDKGAMATDLTLKDFRVSDDGEEQRIQYFSHARQPVSLVLSLDDSQSMKNKVPFVREAAYSLLAPFPDAEGQKNFRDEFLLIRFASLAEVVAQFTGGENLQPRLDTLIQPTEGSTALFDSVYLAVAAEQDALNKRRAIILVTDGGDNHSRYTLKDTERSLEEADMPLFAVMAGQDLNFPGFFAPEKKPKPKRAIPPIIASLGGKVDGEQSGDFIGPAERRGPHNLKALAETTGGAVFTAFRLADLERIVHTIGVAVRYSYIVGFEPSQESVAHPKGWDGWHKLSVQLVPPEKYRGYVVYARRRYYESGALSRRP
jgi:Ca-activated chloride channel homolog